MIQLTETPAPPTEQIAKIRARLPKVLAHELDQFSSFSEEVEVYYYILDFLSTDPSPEAILNFKPTPQMQDRVKELLEKNRIGQLTSPESTELDQYGRVDDFISLLKTQTLKKQQAKLRNGNPT